MVKLYQVESWVEDSVEKLVTLEDWPFESWNHTYQAMEVEMEILLRGIRMEFI